MKKFVRIFLCGILVSAFSLVNASPVDTIRVVTYNILNFPEGMGEERIGYFRVIMDYIHPDIVVAQEVDDVGGLNLFLDSVMNYETDSFETAPFNPGEQYNYNSLFYRTTKVTHDSTKFLQVWPRDIAEYYLRTVSTQKQFRILSLHLKASQDCETERLMAAAILRNHLGSCEVGTNFLVAGDFNIYYSDEPAFHKLTDSLANNNGRLYDPLNAPGYWHNHSEFAPIHSQSTRVTQLPDGGSPGGLDDRFDMILCSVTFLESEGLCLVTDTYTTFGNDGNHFNRAVNSGFNSAVPSNVANALHYASDHLPVYTDIEVEESGTELFNRYEFCLYNYPNPFSSETTIEYTLAMKDEVVLEIYDIVGRRVRTLMNTIQPEGLYRVVWDGKNDAAQSVLSGVYFCRISFGNSSHTKKIILLH